jgi:hypothetical protein
MHPCLPMTREQCPFRVGLCCQLWQEHSDLMLKQ